MSQSLLFDGTLELCGDESSDTSGYRFEALAEGASFGSTAPVEVAIASLLRDGSLTQTESDGNREQRFLIRVKAKDSQSLYEGIAALSRSVAKPTTLVWSPPDGMGPATVFEVLTSSLYEPQGFDDLAFKRNEQTVGLRLVCLPYARSVNLISDDAGTPPSTGGTLLYNCESTTGWSKWQGLWGGGSYTGLGQAVDSVIYTEGAGSIRCEANSQYTPDGVSYYTWQSHDKVTGLSLDTGSGGYMSVSVKVKYEDYTGPPIYQMWQTVGGVETQITNFIASSRDALGFVSIVWQVAGGLTITGLRFASQQQLTGATPTGKTYTWYDNVRLLPTATTDHQIVKQLDVKGSARTQGSLRVAAPGETVALGQVLAITVPTAEIRAGFQPDGRRWVTQGTTTTDTSALWGSYFTPNTTYSTSSGYPIFDVPVSMLTAGPYTVVALVKAESSSLNFGVQAQLRVGSTDVGPTSVAEVSPTGLTTGWQFVTVGTVYLPPLPVQNAATTTKVRLLFKGAKMSDVYMIPAWQVGGHPVADFSIVDCGTGTVSSSLWIESPSTSQPQGGWWRGPTLDRANARSAWPDAKKPGVHSFSPGALTAFLVSTDAAGPTLGLDYYPRWMGMSAL